ncbi:MAG: EAL domain-containing protein [Actinomycetota bacterium]|nr:EAL domain-containing protein [Actinomycetota bacterium]
MAGRFMVGRQPIFDANLDVVGYELLFRGDRSGGPDDDAMTSEVLVRTALDLGLAGVVGDRKAFVNASRAFLVGDLELPLPPDRIVLEVPRSVAGDPEVVAGCARLARSGYAIALDGHRWNDGGDELLDAATFVKLDILTLPCQQLATQVDLLAPCGVQLVAEKVETYEQLEVCRDLGFHLFQGYLLSRPQLVGGPDMPPNPVTLMQLIGEVCNPDTPTRELERIVESDAALSYRLLRVAGAAGGDRRARGVRSIREAVSLLGRQRLRGWLVLMLATDTERAPSEQVMIAMTRAKMCELLAGDAYPHLRDEAFTVGMVSALDLLLQAPLREVIVHLGLAPDIVAAAVDLAGPLGRLLGDVVDWERGEPSAGLRTRVELRMAEKGYVAALRWTTNLLAAVQRAA